MNDTAVNQFIQIMQRMQKSNLNFRHDIGMPHSEYGVLQIIDCKGDKEDGLTITAISEAIQISKPAVSQIINAMEDKEMVERVTTKKDRRIVYVRLTSKGKDALKSARKIASQRLGLVLDQMGEVDAHEFLRLLDRFATITGELTLAKEQQAAKGNVEE